MTDPFSVIGAKLPPDPNPELHAQYQRELNIDAGAALLMSWTDKQRQVAKNSVSTTKSAAPDRDFETIPAEQQALYRHLVYRLLDAMTNRA